MFDWKNWSIRKKLRTGFMLVSTAAMLFVSFMIILFYSLTLRNTLQNNITAHAEAISQNCRAALTFNVPEDALVLLGALSSENSVVFACILDQDQEIFAHYCRDDRGNQEVRPSLQYFKDRFRGYFLHVEQPFHIDDKISGSVYIIAELAEIYNNLRTVSVIILFAFLASLILVYTLSSQLQRILSSPILSLSETATKIAGTRDYSLRAEKRSSDEVGSLIDSFNDMLSQIQLRDLSLQESEERFRIIFEQAAVGVAQIETKTGRFLRINQRYCDIVGYSREGMLTTTFMDITHPEDLQKDLDNMQKLIAGEIRQFSMVQRYFHKEGHIVWVNLYVSPMWAIGQEPNHHIAVVEDITEHKQAEEALHRYEHIVSSSTDMLALLDKQFTYLAANEAYLEAFQLTSEQLLGKTVANVFGEDLFNTVFLPNAQSCLGGEIAEYQNWLDIPAYGRRYMDIHYYPYYDRDDKIIGFVVNWRDATERKRDEEEKTKLQEQLRQAQKMESIGTLAGGIAHDFNNLLAIIVGNAELAMNDIPERNQACHNLDEVIKASLRARDMVKQILAFSRQHQEHKRPVRVTPIIEESLKLLRSSLPTTIEIRLNLSAHADIILGDTTQITQILMNLCSNSAHAMREEGGILEIGLKNIDLDEQDATHYHGISPGEYLTLTVSDTGRGMKPEVIGRIFDPFFTTKEVGKGTGMGLSVTHGIVKNHNGAIRVCSEPGQGTTFHLIFPLIEGETEAPATVPGPLPTGTERILFVDDEKALTDLWKRMLIHFGYEVTVSTSSVEALELFRAQPDRFDLVITDMTMPNMTGKDLSQELLRLRPDIPIILCTGFSEMITEEKAEQMGIKAFVMKPLVLREIAQTVRQVLDQEA